MNSKILGLAIRTAELSCHRHRLGCVIFKKKSIISVAYNEPFGLVGNLHPKYICWPHSIHAETKAITSAKHPLKNCEMLVIRLNRRGDLRLAKPCEYCEKYIRDVKIKKVYYSTNEGEIKTMRIRR